MTRATVAVLVLTGVAIAAWLTVGAGRGVPRQPRRAATDGRGGVADPLAAGVRGQADRLRAHLAEPRPIPPVRRDPFRFADAERIELPARRAPAPVPDPSETNAPPETPAPPDMRLSGVAEDVVGGVPVRTAVVSAANRVFLVREGDRLLTRYVVARIGVDTVVLTDDAGGGTVTIAWR